MATVKPYEQSPRRSFTLASDLEASEQTEVWKHWLVAGQVTILGGMPGTAKSTFLADLASRITRDDLMPDGTRCGNPGGIVFISYEEHTTERVIPRYFAQGAVMGRIAILSKVKREVTGPGQASETRFCLPDDLPTLRDAIRYVHASLVVIDPLMSMANPKFRLYGNQSTRELLQTLQDLAEDMGVAVIVINHFTKGNQKDPLSSLAGSKGSVDFVRSVWLASKDTAVPGRILLNNEKHSNGPETPQLAFSHDGTHVAYLDGITPAQEAKHEREIAESIRTRVLSLLGAHPKEEYTPSWIAQELGVNVATIKTNLGRMVARGEIAKTQYGRYKHLKQRP